MHVGNLACNGLLHKPVCLTAPALELRDTTMTLCMTHNLPKYPPPRRASPLPPRAASWRSGPLWTPPLRYRSRHPHGDQLPQRSSGRGPASRLLAAPRGRESARPMRGAPRGQMPLRYSPASGPGAASVVEGLLLPLYPGTQYFCVRLLGFPMR